MKRIFFISTHSFATNPRMVKEIDLALNSGYDVSVLCVSFNNWSKDINEELKKRLAGKIKYYEIPGNRKPFFPWAISSVCVFLAKVGLVFFPENVHLLSLFSNKRSWLLLKRINKVEVNPDFIIAHNIGSFYPAMRFAKKMGIGFGIDLEDYHPGETSKKRTIKRLKNLLKKTLPKATYFSAASPLILQYALNDIGRCGNFSKVIMNWFYSNEFQKPREIQKSKLQIVWFSQNIAHGRGLEQIIPIVKAMESSFDLHLYGNIYQDFFNEWIDGAKNIFVHEAMPQKLLHRELSYYDVGLAVEPGKDLNNELALSNKLFGYIQAGLYIIASNTLAQRSFMQGTNFQGYVVDMKPHDLQIAFEAIEKNKFEIRSVRNKRFDEARQFSWEMESLWLTEAWESLIH